MSPDRFEQLSPEAVAELQSRLERIQQWGGAYAEIDFSPQLKARLRADYDGHQVELQQGHMAAVTA